MKLVGCILSSGFLLLNAVNFYGSETESLFVDSYRIQGKSSFNHSQNIANEVKKAFEAVRKKTNGQILLEKLKLHGEKVIPYLESYLNDESVDVRREVIYLTMKIGGEKSLNLLALALNNSESEIQKITSDQLYFYYSQYKKYLPHKEFLPLRIYAPYESFSPEKIKANQLLGKALKESLKRENRNISTVYLLANFTDSETINLLQELSLKSSTEFDSSSIAAKIILSNLDDQKALDELTKLINKNDVKTSLFLLDQINEINSINLLSLLTKTLDDKSDITEGKGVKNPNISLSNRVKIQQIPARRLCDFAVNAFVGKFNFKTSFPLHSTLYLEKQISEVRNLVKQTIPIK